MPFPDLRDDEVEVVPRSERGAEPAAAVEASCSLPETSNWPLLARVAATATAMARARWRQLAIGGPEAGLWALKARAWALRGETVPIARTQSAWRTCASSWIARCAAAAGREDRRVLLRT